VFDTKGQTAGALPANLGQGHYKQSSFLVNYGKKVLLDLPGNDLLQKSIKDKNSLDRKFLQNIF
jgi:hypothetical protein